MLFEDEPLAGENLPILPGHVSPGRLERVLRAGGFAVTTEIAPPDSADPAEVYARAAVFDGCVDAINATDGSGANCHMSSVGICSLLTRRGYAMVMQVSCRDRNRIAIQGDVLGAAAMGVANILCLTGDGVQSGDHPQAKPVFDLDSMSALEMLRGMRDDSRFMSGRRITSAPRVFLGAAANPFAEPLDARPLRLARKISAGAQFIQTQYCFDIEMFRQYMARVRNLGLHEKVYILAGVGPLASARSAEWVRANVAGVHIPDSVIRRLRGAADQAREGVNVCVDMIHRIREIEGIHGVHIMAYRQEHRVAEIVETTGVLDGRTPWHPGGGGQTTGDRGRGAEDRRQRTEDGEPGTANAQRAGRRMDQASGDRRTDDGGQRTENRVRPTHNGREEEWIRHPPSVIRPLSSAL